MMKQSIQNFN